MFDRGRVHAADGEVQIDAAEHFDARHFLADDLREASGRVVVVLEDDRAHAAVAGELRGIDGVHRSRGVVGRGVNVDVDGAGERPVVTARLVRAGSR